jgi:hypothetical protein
VTNAIRLYVIRLLSSSYPCIEATTTSFIDFNLYRKHTLRDDTIVLKVLILHYSCPVNKSSGNETIIAHLIVIALVKLCIIFRHGLCFSFNGILLISFTFYISTLLFVLLLLVPMVLRVLDGRVIKYCLVKLVIIYYWHVVNTSRGKF